MPRRDAWRRPRPIPLTAGIVVMAETEAELVPEAEAQLARVEDAIWAKRIRRPFSWQAHLDWWCARRWVMPRDVRKW